MRGVYDDVTRCAVSQRGKTYAYGDTSDLACVVEHLHQLYPEAPLFGVGLSAGSNTLLKYMAEQSDDCKLLCGVSSCNAFDLERVRTSMLDCSLFKSSCPRL